MAQFILGPVLSNDGRGISATHNDNCPIFGSFDVRVEQRLRAIGESWELKDARWARIENEGSAVEGSGKWSYKPIPGNSLGLQNGGAEQFSTFRASIKTHPTIRDALGLESTADLHFSCFSALTNI